MTAKYGRDKDSWPEDNDIWEEVAGVTKRGTLRGLGSASTSVAGHHIEDPSPPPSQNCSSTPAMTPEFFQSMIDNSLARALAPFMSQLPTPSRVPPVGYQENQEDEQDNEDGS